MRNLLLLIVVVAGVAFGYPLVAEDTTSPCDALERVTVRVVSAHDKDDHTGSLVLGNLLQGLSRGQFASVAAKDRYPQFPPALACTVLYWQAVVDSEDFVKDVVKPH
jgi:hypothetical protein